jgi:predicted aspartyl protease
VKVNGNPVTLLLDAGASGVLITSKSAEKLGVEKVTETRFGGIGDRAEQEGYVGFVQNIQIGELSFQNCYVGVVEKVLSSSEDGLIGADVFADFLVELNFPDQKMLLSKLPTDPTQPAQTPELSTQNVPNGRFHDRYIAPEMR